MPKTKTARKPMPTAADQPEVAEVDGLSPRSQRRRQEILDAATALFLEKGFSGCSIDDVISRTGGSKRTIYKLFPCKHDLFVAIAQGIAHKVLQPIEMPQLSGRPIEDVLQEFGETFLKVLTSNEFAQFYRGIVSEAVRFPECASGVFEAGPARVTGALTEVMGHFESLGEVSFEDREEAAAQFVSMLRTERIFAVALGLRPPPDNATIRRSVTQAVSIFLDGCRTRKN